MTPEAYGELSNLLRGLYSADELRRFVRQVAPEVVDRVDWAGPLAQVADDVTDGLRRHGVVDDRFFAALIRERPRRQGEIERVRRGLAPTPGRDRESVFIISSSARRTEAGRLARALAVAGAEVWFDQRLVAGAEWRPHLDEWLRAATVVVVVVGGERLSPYGEAELSVALARAREGKARLVPVRAPGARSEDLPPALAAFNGLGIDDLGYEGAARLIVARPSAIPLSLAAGIDGHAPVARLTREFFAQAGRAPTLDAAHQLRVPEPVHVVEHPPSASDLHALASGQLEPGGTGFFTFPGVLTDDAFASLLGLRAKGFAVVTLSETTMVAALADGRAREILAAAIREQTGLKNAFRAGNATVEPRLLFGRGPLLAQVGQALSTGDHVLLTGTRKSGKTSFLNVLRQGLVDRPVASVDLQGVDLRAAGWPDALFGRVVEAYDRWGARRWEADWPFPPSSSPVADLERALDARLEAATRLGQSRVGVVVMLDELERVYPASGSDPTTWIRFSGVLRSVAQGRAGALAILAADLRPRVNRENALGARTNPFFQLFREEPVPPLDPVAVGEMLSELGRATGIYSLEPGFVERCHALGGGHPWVTRTLAAAAADARRLPTELGLADLDAGLEDLYERDELGNFFRQNFWAPLEPAERALLQACVEGRPLPRGGPARASLRAQQLLVGGRVPIGAFEAWLREATFPARAAK